MQIVLTAPKWIFICRKKSTLVKTTPTNQITNQNQIMCLIKSSDEFEELLKIEHKHAVLYEQIFKLEYL